MNWLNVPLHRLRSPDVIAAPPAARGTWLRVTGFCCECENSGIIAGAATWTDRQWLTTCGVTKAEVQDSSPLITFDGENAMVSMYPLDKQIDVAAKRLAGLKGAKTKWHGSATGSVTNSANDSARGKEKEKENSKKKKKGSTSAASAEELGKSGRNGSSELLEVPAQSKPGSFPLPETVAAGIRTLYRRKDSTAWDPKEITAARCLSTRGEEQMLGELRLFRDARAAGWTYYRKDVLTLINNWQVEVDRAGEVLSSAGRTDKMPQAVPAVNLWAQDHLPPTERTK